MTFDAWLADSQGPGWSDKDSARRWNLLAETRIPDRIAAFKAMLGEAHGTECADTGDVADRSQAALIAFEAMIRETEAVESPWLGHLRFKAGDAVPTRMCTHVPLRNLRRRKRAGRISPDEPPRRIRMDRPLKMAEDGRPRARFIWVTFATAESPLTDDPAAAMRELGLAWYDPGDHIYRVELKVDPGRLHVPTCLDANINEAWAPPPPGTAWGMTRHLETGVPCRPELLTETGHHAGTLPMAELVSPPNEWRTVGEVVCDYLCNRGDHGQ